jgi:hypothetical protein
MSSEEQGERQPTRVTKWDIFALLTETLSNHLIISANMFAQLTQMFDTQAVFVEEKESFHEYVARTIETLNEGD